MLTHTDKLSKVTTYTNNSQGQVTSITLPDPDGAGSLSSPVYTVAFNSVNKMTSTTDPLGNVTTYSYDNIDRLINVVQPDPDGAGSQSSASQSYEYDLLSRVTSHKKSQNNPLDQTTTYTYDNVNRLTQVTEPDPDGAGSQTAPVSNYTYNANGLRLTETNPLGEVTTWTYDNLNRMTQITEPDPDGAGSLTSPITVFAYSGICHRTRYSR
ncbi:MAG: hypothetical protein O2856_00185 [Planctomycetota bacterium]|nr:hypothetical protein [Planctomycetota bacterium]